MLKVNVGVEPEIMNDIDQSKDRPYNLRHKFLVKSKNVRSVNYGTHTASFIGPISMYIYIYIYKCMYIYIYIYKCI